MSANLDSSFFGIHENIILTKNGVWLSNGEEITHPGTLLGFSRHVHRSPNGFEIRIGTEAKRIHIEDTIYFVKSIDGAPDTGFTLQLNDGRTLKLEPATLKYQPGRLTCRVPHPNNDTREEAKFLSASYYEILKHLEKTPLGFEIEIEGQKIVLARESI